MRANNRTIFQYDSMVTQNRVTVWLIPLFCLWHMFAVSAFIIPISYPGGMGTVGEQLRGFSSPYVLALSQWQQWNLFAPDPIRRVSEYSIDRDVKGVWTLTTLIDPKAHAFYEYSKLMKVLGRLETTHSALVEPFLRFYCDESGARLRLRIDSYILPSDLRSLTRLNASMLPRTQKITRTIDCPLLQHP